MKYRLPEQISDSRYKRISDTIKQMEVDLGLLRDYPYGRRARLAWESVRFSVHTELKQRLCGHGVAHTQPIEYSAMDLCRLARLGVRILYNAIYRCPFLAPRGRRYLVFPHPRRKLAEDGFYDELYIEPFLPELGLRRTVVVEKPVQWKHSSPTRYGQPWYAESIMLLAKFASLFAKRHSALAEIAPMARNVRVYLQTHLETNVNVHSRLVQAAVKDASYRTVYTVLLRWLRPLRVIMVVSYNNEPLVMAARDLEIPTIELQHGVITSFHFGYVVPCGEKKISFPDYLFTFGRYWSNTLNYSLTSDRVIPIGYPYFEQERRKYRNTSKANKVLIISQGNVGVHLSSFAVELAKMVPDSWQIVYKLHPGEYERWRNEYPKLKSASDTKLLTVVEDNRAPFYALLAESRWQIGVNSTAIFEGIGLGCNTILVNLPGIEYMEGLIEAGVAVVVDHPEAAKTALRRGNSHNDIDIGRFFQRNPSAYISKALESVT